MERDVMDIVREKEFIELTAAERAELDELCSTEEEYNQIKSMFVGLGAMNWSNPTPKAETKERLDHLFAQQHAKAAPIWYNAPLAVLIPKGKPVYRQPLVQAAAVGLLIFLAYPFVNSNIMTTDNKEMAVLEENTSEKEDLNKSEMNEDANLNSEQDVNKQEELSDLEAKENGTEGSFISKEQSEPLAPMPVRNDVGKSADFASELAAETVTTKDLEMTWAWDDAGTVASTPGSTHPDGVFIGDKKEIFSAPASSEPAVFDLLTTTF